MTTSALLHWLLFWLFFLYFCNFLNYNVPCFHNDKRYAFPVLHSKIVFSWQALIVLLENPEFDYDHSEMANWWIIPNGKQTLFAKHNLPEKELAEALHLRPWKILLFSETKGRQLCFRGYPQSPVNTNPQQTLTQSWLCLNNALSATSWSTYLLMFLEVINTNSKTSILMSITWGMWRVTSLHVLKSLSVAVRGSNTSCA